MLVVTGNLLSVISNALRMDYGMFITCTNTNISKDNNHNYYWNSHHF